MKSLGSLFSNAETEGNDALRYSAPKEPKARSSSSSAPTPTPAQPTIAPAAQQPAAKPATKILCSAAIKLYKVNPTSGSYEVHANGAQLGCVLIGLNATFQIYVYDANKASQVSVTLLPSFQYNIRDLYMSFTDSKGDNWSLLFDLIDTMTNFTRTLVATLAHIATHAEPQYQKAISGMLPVPAGSTEDSSTALAAGMAAGIYYSIWETGDLETTPSEVLTSPAWYRISPPMEVAKLKMGGDEPIGGLGAVLTGRKKGDRVFIGLPPHMCYSGTQDLANRHRPGTFLLLEVEVVKVKSADKEKKKEKKSKAEEHPTEFASSSGDGRETAADSDLTTRMARLAQKSGVVQIPMAAAPAFHHHPPQQQQYQQQHAQQYQQPQPTQYQQPQQQYQQQQQQQQRPEEYAMVMVPGEEVRSHYSDASPPSWSNQHYPAQAQHHPGLAPPSDAASPAILAALTGMQSSLMQLHSKVDRSNMLLGSGGMGMGMGMGGMGDIGGGMQMQQMQAQMQAMQMQLLQAKMSAGMQGGTPRAAKVQADEAISTLQQSLSFLLAEADKAADQAGKTAVSEAASAENRRTAEALEKLDAKNSSLQDKVDKLMEEKAALLQKQADMIQLGSDSNSKVFTIQAELEAAKRAQTAAENSVAANNEELRSCKLSLQTTQSALAAAAADLDVARSLPAVSSAPSQIDITSIAYLTLLEEHVGPHKSRADAAEKDVQATKEALASASNETNSLRDSLSAAESELGEARATIESLKTAAASAPAASSATDLDSDAIKSLMQDVYEKACEIFVPAEENSGTVTYSPAEVVKRLKAVLKRITATPRA